jgi:hypothetical protein
MKTCERASGAGAYSQFKRLLKDEAMLDHCYSYEAAAMEKAIREWCQTNSIQIVKD